MISLNAHAKINLSLDVINKREDGYHNLQMIMQTLALHDTVSLSEIPSGIELQCQAPYVPNNSSNIAYKAAERMIERFKLDCGIRIVIDKRIPVAAGLAGGSTDAAAVLKGMNILFKLKLELGELIEIGRTIGADVPYCLMGGTALAEGIGEKLTPLEPLNGIPVLLAKPRLGVSTAWVFKNLNLEKVEERPDTSQLLDAVSRKDIGFIARNMHNVLEEVTIAKYPLIDRLKKDMVEKGAMGSMMSGSGPTVFAVFENEARARRAFNMMNRQKNKKYDMIFTHIKDMRRKR